MKEKINLLSRGIFEYEKPDVVVSEEMIRIEVEAGISYTGFFDVTSINECPIRAMVFSSNKLITCKESMIVGNSCRVNYVFYPQHLEPGETVEGHISIISNAGEIQVPFLAQVCLPFVTTGIGEIRDLHQFSRLAQTNWHEAARLFCSADFERVFLVNKKYAHIYDSLVKSRNTNQAMEEFLCTTRRKPPVRIRVSQDELYFENLHEEHTDKLVIEKDGWGYKRIFVRTIGDFIHVLKTELTTQDFIGSYYELPYVIYPQAFGQGNNYGKIIISTFDESIEIPVNCMREERSTQWTMRRSVRSSVYDILTHYLQLLMEKESKEEWTRKTREAIDCCRNNSDDLVYELMEAHFSLLAGEDSNAAEILNSKNSREIRHESVILYDYYLYLVSLLRRDEEYTRFALDKMTSDYSRQYDYWQILWLILQMNDRLGAARRLGLLHEQFDKGCRSPFIYWEAVKVYNTDPSLLRELTQFEIQVISWAEAMDCLKRDVVFQFSEVCVRSKTFSALVLKTLISFSEIYQEKEILLAVCSMLIKGHKTDSCYNRWYALGIESSLKLTNIYEYYMYSLDESSDPQLPLGVLIYFNYDNRLPAAKKAFLYAYVVQNREKYPKIYRDYENIIKAFTYEQLKNGYISRDMVILYHQFITMDKVNVNMAGLLPKVLFKYEIFCDHKKIRGVIVSHRQVDQDIYYPLNDGVAFVDIYMDEYQLIFVDRDENRYIGSVKYKKQRLMDDPELLRECYRMDPQQPMILLNRSERAIRYHKMDEASIDIYKRVLRLPHIHEGYQRNVLKNLIDFYYDNYEGDTLERYLLRLDISLMDTKERGRIIEYYIQRGLFEKALDAIRVYGYENIQDKKLMRLCSRTIRSTDFAEDSLLIEMSYSAFSDGKYDDAILEYLIRYYLGTTGDLYAIWKAAQDFEVQAYELEERLLCQILFAESHTEHGIEIFASYYRMKPDPRIVRAFLAYNCYGYLVRGTPLDEALFRYVEIELDQMEQAYDVCALAMLKHYAADEGALTGHEEWVRQHLGGFMERGMILPFFSAFVHIANLPEELLDKVYVQYSTNPRHTVTICYECHRIGSPAGQYTTEDMKNVFGGLFVKDFVVFANEEIRYTMTEKSQYSEKVTDAQIIQFDAGQETDPTNVVSRINHLILLAEDDAQLQLEDGMREFESLRYLSKKLFSMIQ